jgi:ribosomal-protein-alanine acetyltransferase
MNRLGADITICRMTESDLDAVMAISQTLPDAPEWPREAYLAAIDPGIQPPRIALVARASDSQIAGFTIAVLILPQAELETIAVGVQAQRRGVGQQLFLSLRTELKKAHITEIALEVRRSNYSAQGFYRSLGFIEIGGRDSYYVDPIEDALLLQLRIS